MMGKLKDRKRWAALIVQYAKSGLAAHEWCTQNGVTQNQLGYRLRQAYTISENKPQREISQKQLEANRKNALKSTGPRTPEGKAAISRNALKHGIFARDKKNAPVEMVEWTAVEIVEEAALSEVVAA